MVSRSYLSFEHTPTTINEASQRTLIAEKPAWFLLRSWRDNNIAQQRMMRERNGENNKRRSHKRRHTRGENEKAQRLIPLSEWNWSTAKLERKKVGDVIKTCRRVEEGEEFQVDVHLENTNPSLSLFLFVQLIRLEHPRGCVGTN